MDDIDLTMLAYSAYRAILKSLEAAEAHPEESNGVREAAPMSAPKD